MRKTRLGEFWVSVWRNYGYAVVLGQSQVEWIIKAKSEGEMTNEAIARAQTISVSRVQQLHREYRRTGAIPVLKRAGRPRAPLISEQERAIIRRACDKFRMCASYLEPVILFNYGVKINHKRIHRILREEGLALNESGAVKKAKELADESIPIVVGTPTIFELYVGVGLIAKPVEEKERIQSILRSLTQLPLDSNSATRAGSVYAQTTREGSKIDPEGAMLAGITVESAQPILTRNKRYFSGITDLKVESY